MKRVEEQLEHIRTATEAGAAAAAEAGGSEELGDVPDLGLSEDVFAGPSIGGLDALRNALPEQEPEAPEAPEESPPRLPRRRPPRPRSPRPSLAAPGRRSMPSCLPTPTPPADEPDQAPPAAPEQDEEQPKEE